MASKNEHLTAILAMRVSWTTVDEMQAKRLAMVRVQIDKLTEELDREGYTVPTRDLSTEKPNPKISAREKLVREDNQLTRRLGLGAQRTKGGRAKAADSPMEKRKELWEQWADHCRTNLIPGLWLHLVKEANCDIASDHVFATDNPRELPT
ncbi:hypothetical protein AQ910_29010 [Burkholderia pseudomallei]|uniref:P27 family phage terminase small subunit n=1 Tax=Burkholderia pseudomallei TaxID=28450 RepID=UPI0005366942|nr:P27 family phage terminase small subunit [Burkholderia pseudomallei]KGX76421.1 hypothetical protein Y033_2046 [Burkholderia pseudomallei MSHR435]ONC08408.1 hypothetical protein AQ910_29010 [Burkholderia pseudomallei]